MGVSRQTVGEEYFRQRNIQGPWGVEIKGLLVFWCGWSVRLMEGIGAGK